MDPVAMKRTMDAMGKKSFFLKVNFSSKISIKIAAKNKMAAATKLIQ